MSLSEQDYGQVARWLDGEDVELTAAQRALAEEVAADSERVGRALEVELPAGTLHRVAARLAAGAARPRAKRHSLGWAGAVAAAAVIAAGLWMFLRPGGAKLSPREYVEAFLEPPPDRIEAQVELLAEDVADCQLELSLGDLRPLEVGLQALEDRLSGFDTGGEDSPEAAGEDADEQLW